MQQWRAAVLTSALLALTPTPSLAAPVACSPGTLTDYVALGDGCTVGGFLFDNFTLGTTLPTGATPISPDVVEVTPVPSGLKMDPVYQPRPRPATCGWKSVSVQSFMLAGPWNHTEWSRLAPGMTLRSADGSTPVEISDR